ncbi:MAG: hypothetical protein KDK50_01615 [Chlamydiia bacterium]|nr:hypothetical protein [Chlamydiia bacterium]
MLWCGCALVLCFSAFFYGKSLAFWGVQKLATRFDHTAVIKAQDITFGRGGLKLKSVSASGSFGQVDADSCEVLFRFSLKPFGFRPYITLDHPTWIPQDKVAYTELKPSKLRAPHLTIRNGIIEKENISLPFAFTSGTSLGDVGLLELDEGAFELMLKKNEEGSFVIGRFFEADFKRLAPLRSLIKNRLSWMPEQGIAHGHLSAGWDDDGDLCDLSGDIEIKEPAFWHGRRQLKVGAQKFVLKGAFPSQEIHLSSGYFLALHPKLPAQWGLQLSGSVIPEKFKTQIALKGAVVREDAFFPIAIEGEGKISGGQSLQTTLNISGEGKSEITFEVTRGGYGKIEGIFDQISSKQLLLFRDGLAAFFPRFADLELEGEACNAHVVAKLAKRHLQEVALKHVSAQSIAVKWPSMKAEGCGRHIQATASLPFENGPQWKKGNWDLEIQEGEIASFLAHHLKLKVNGEAIQECRFDGNFGGLHIEGSGQGELHSPSLALSVNGNTKQLADLLEVSPPEDIPFAARLLVDRKDKDWSFATRIKCGGSSKCAFGIRCSPDDLKEQKFDCVKGWCEADHMPAALYQILLQKLKIPCAISGDISLSGNFNGQGVQIDFTSPEIICEMGEHVLKLPIPALKQKASLAYKQGELNVSLQLDNAKMIDKALGLTFENLKGLLTIDGNELRSSNLVGQVNEIGFKGQISVGLNTEVPDICFKADEIYGDAKNLIEVLSHFDALKALALPLSGDIYAVKGPALEINTRQKLCKARVQLKNGHYALTKNFFGKGLDCQVKFSSDDEVLQICGLHGSLIVVENDKQFDYEVSAPKLALRSRKSMQWDYDLRIESQTHDLMRFTGTLQQDPQSVVVELDPKYSHLFGAPLQLTKCSLSNTLEEISLVTQVEMSKLPMVCRFLNALDLIKFTPGLTQNLAKMNLKGQLDLDWKLSPSGWSFDCSSKNMVIANQALSNFALGLEYDLDSLTLSHLNIGSFEAAGLCEKTNDLWSLNLFEAKAGNSSFTSSTGTYDALTGNLALSLDTCQIDLQQFLLLLPQIPEPYLNGIAHINECQLHWDMKLKAMAARFQLQCDSYSDANFTVSSTAPIEMTFDPETGIQLHNAHLQLSHPQLEAVDGKLLIGSLDYQSKEKRFSCDNFHISLTPELIFALARSHLLPYVDTLGDQLTVAQIPFRWDNHLETRLEFCLSPGSFSLLADLKDGYYWIGDLSCFLRGSKIKGTNSGLYFESFTKLQSADFTVEASLPFDKHRDPKLILNDSSGHENPLTIKFSHGSKSLIDSAVGHFCGLDLNFHAKPIDSGAALALTGEVDIDWNAAAKLMPSKIAQVIQDFDLGRGYKIAGDLSINLKDPEQSTFEGFFKGKDFELIGYRFKNLLASTSYAQNSLTLSGFTLADDALSLNIPLIQVDQNRFSIPELKMLDLRPSRLSKAGRKPGRLKPFVVRNLDFHNIEGNLSDKKSITGTGQLNFINTFKRNVSLLDIPKEVLGRIGLDVGLLVPVRGHLTCSLKNGRFYLDSLTDAYSDGERSQFFLSPKKESYIDFDGHMHIDIRMKQFVLLKITEFFTLSLRGSLEHPKYQLK